MGSANNSHRQLTLLSYDPITFFYQNSTSRRW